MELKAAVYCGTRNLYPHMVTAAKSLAVNSGVDVIYFLIEDASFPYHLPDYVNCIDVSGQKFFNKYGPNVYRLWTWMVLMRAVLTKYFPQHDRILSLDVDTIVDQNIDELWDLDLNGYYLAGVPEPKKSNSNASYVNMGVALFNLKKLREDMVDDRVIYLLNNQKYRFAEQDCINSVCRNQILTLPSMYNWNSFVAPCDSPKIRHFACNREWYKTTYYQKYQNLNWKEIRRPECAT